MNQDESMKRLIKNGYFEWVYTPKKSIFINEKGIKITLLKNGKTRITTNKDLEDCGV